MRSSLKSFQRIQPLSILITRTLNSPVVLSCNQSHPNTRFSFPTHEKHTQTTRLFSTHDQQSLDFHQQADTFFDNLVDYLEELGDDTSLEGFDVLYSSGVLTLKLGENGTYVLNKQPPNRQICGPKRFDWDVERSDWVSGRDGQSIKELLDEELSQVFKHTIETP